MSEPNAIEKCKAFINCNFQAAESPAVRHVQPGPPPIITISREAGAGARTIGNKLAEYLQQHAPDPRCEWTFFHRNLVEKVLEDHHLSQRLAKFMPEEKSSEINGAVREFLGLHPSLWTLAHYTTDTILRLSQLGRVIIVGRGSMVITSNMPHAFHVRLIGTPEKRAAHVREFYQMTLQTALDFIREEDHKRAQYLKKYFGRRIDDPLLYHLILNTDKVTYEEAVRIIGDAVLNRMKNATNTPA